MSDLCAQTKECSPMNLPIRWHEDITTTAGSQIARKPTRAQDIAPDEDRMTDRSPIAMLVG